MANLPISQGAPFGVPPPAPTRSIIDTAARNHQPRPNGRHSLMTAPMNRTARMLGGRLAADGPAARFRTMLGLAGGSRPCLEGGGRESSAPCARRGVQAYPLDGASDETLLDVRAELSFPLLSTRKLGSRSRRRWSARRRCLAGTGAP